MARKPKVPKNLLRRADIVAQESGPFSHPWNPKSELRGVQLARTVGMSRAMIAIARMAPGKESFISHRHKHEEEWLYILSGHGIAEIDGVEHEVGPGDFMGFPAPSVTHHLRNPGPEDLVYLMGGENRDVEVAEFPAIGKVMLREGGDIRIFDAADAQAFGPIKKKGRKS